MPDNSNKQPKSPTTGTILAQHADAIRALGKRAIGDIIEIGRLLTEAKQIAGHGGWLPWLDREFGWSEDTAERFMSLNRLQGQIPQFAEYDLPISGLYLLAAPSTPKEARNAVIERAESGERLSVKAVRNQIAEASKKHAPAADRQPTRKPATTNAAPEPAPQKIDPDDLIAQFTEQVHDDGVYIVNRVSAAYRSMLVERLREVVDEIALEADRWAKEAQLDEGIPEFLRRAP